MFNSVQDYTLSILPSKKRRSQAGWLSFNAVCCQHNGESADTRGRGGIITNVDGGVSYSCFNCKFKTSYQPGRPLSFKFRKLLGWLGADSNEVKRLVIEAVRLKDLIRPEDITAPEEEIVFEARTLPQEARSFNEMATFIRLQDEDALLPAEFNRAVEFVYKRLGSQLSKYDFYWTPEVEHKLSHRVVVPFYYKGNIVGYTARAVEEGIKPKYHSNHPSNFVFNMDQQLPDNKFVIVVEGPFDAMSIDAVSVQTNDISEQQADIIESLSREVIVVPDWDKPGQQMIDRAIEYGWSVSFPVWRETCKDAGEAVERYGRLFVLKAIIDAKESNALKIKLRKTNY
jgi:hypothetical protein